MKKTMLIIIATLHISFMDAMADETNLFHGASSVSESLHRTEMANKSSAIPRIRYLLEQIRSMFNDPHVEHFYYTGVNFWKIPEFVQLTETVTENWTEIADNIKNIVGTSELHQAILFMSFYALPQEDFFDSLNRIADLALDNVVSDETFFFNMLFDRVDLVHFGWAVSKTPYTIARNYDHPVVAEMLQKAQKIDPKNNKWLYEPMASGKIKREVTSMWWDSHTGYGPPSVIIRELLLMFPWYTPGILFVISIGAVIIIRKIRRKRSRQIETGK